MKMKSLVRKRKKREFEAAVMVQKYCKGYITAKRYFKIKGEFMIDQTLKEFMRIRKEIEFTLAHLIYFTWKCYKGRKVRLKREAEERKAASKARKGKKKGKFRASSFSTKTVGKKTSPKAATARKRINSTNNAAGGINVSDVDPDTMQ
eukprot:CAMPEP_0185591634 /NCGR_PEP_ID=MMETSP0434-20130131/65153_1 /TAXON_ID=626734 ORGANISM="Favella taraikaensis, Strain Fe Narragansett Bay" /NCGR_SAMPLE_ID=MMETSP0434 /ASSEMBLY_ACC=CAM_ASM_000379 /LENGTH=147 /DNA_ID=CAMNT_0028216797 /DNA_START=937 /DNA_END=1380 /DNA_ORIENTATION=-